MEDLWIPKVIKLCITYFIYSMKIIHEKKLRYVQLHGFLRYEIYVTLLGMRPFSSHHESWLQKNLSFEIKIFEVCDDLHSRNSYLQNLGFFEPFFTILLFSLTYVNDRKMTSKATENDKKPTQGTQPKKSCSKTKHDSSKAVWKKHCRIVQIGEY